MEINVLKFRLYFYVFRLEKCVLILTFIIIMLYHFLLKRKLIGEFNITKIPESHTRNVKSAIPLNFFSALQVKRMTQKPFEIQVYITHHCLYQSLPHDGTFIFDALTKKEHPL